MKKYTRLALAISKFFFCLRVAGDTKIFLRLLIQTKLLARYKAGVAGGIGEEYDGQAKALAYRIRYLSRERTIYLRTYTGDIRMFYEVFWERAYWLPSAILVMPIVIVDAGANIGMAALYFSIIYPQARIYCIEPDAHNFKLLRENLAPEGERCVLIEAALYDRDGEVGLIRERMAYNSKVDEGADRRVVVPAVTMEVLLDRFQLSRIDLLKIDIEGAEDKLFSAPTAWLEKVNTILIEVHSEEAIGPIRSRMMENGFHWQAWEGRRMRWGRPAGGGSLYLASRTEMSRLASS